MAELLEDVKSEFSILNSGLDRAVEMWSEFQKPIPKNYETTFRMFAPNPYCEWVQEAYFKWEDATNEELVHIGNSYGFKYDVDRGCFKQGNLNNLIESSLNKLRLYYNYDVAGGNRSIDNVLENIATLKFSLTKDDIYSEEVLRVALELLVNAKRLLPKVFKMDEMSYAHTECKELLNNNVKRCAAHMRPIYQKDFEFIMSEVESFSKYDGSADLVRKIMDVTYNGDFDTWYDSTVACYGSLDVIHDLEEEVQHLASDLGIDVWFI